MLLAQSATVNQFMVSSSASAPDSCAPSRATAARGDTAPVTSGRDFVRSTCGGKDCYYMV